MKVSILVNEGSASASEVFTGAMKDYHKAKVYGSKTFGKGIVQTTREFSDGSLIKYTEMKWLTPDGHYIHGKGIRPDVSISTQNTNHSMSFQITKLIIKVKKIKMLKR